MQQTMDNPYRDGTHAYVMFDNMLPSKMSASKGDLIGQYKACQRLAGDWLNQGTGARSQFDFESEVIATVFKHRFEQQIEVACLQLT